ncbi:MAG: hypothetical protein WEA61_02170 [Anaerolineales bacterium]
MTVVVAACGAPAGQPEGETEASPTSYQPDPTLAPTEPSPTLVRLYYPNKLVGPFLVDAHATGDIQPLIDALDPRIHIEERAFVDWVYDPDQGMIPPPWLQHMNFEWCAGDYAYLEMPMDSDSVSAENMVELLFTHQLSDEERALGFYSELRGLDLLDLQSDKSEVVLSLQDQAGFFAEGGGQPYLQWEQESGFYGGPCFWEVIVSQIVATLTQAYPECVALPPFSVQGEQIQISVPCEPQD